MRAGRVASFWGNAIYICTRMLMYELPTGCIKSVSVIVMPLSFKIRPKSKNNSLIFSEIELMAASRKYPNKFGISLNLNNFLTLKKANIFAFFSLNRNFALSLALPKILSFEKNQKSFGFLLTYSYLCTKNIL